VLADVPALDALGGAPSALRLRRRHLAQVTVVGTSRWAVSIAATLAAAGVGAVQISASGEVRAADSCPGGLLPDDEGRRFAGAAAEAVRRAAPEAKVTTTAAEQMIAIRSGTAEEQVPSECRRADLVVLADPGPVEPEQRQRLHEASIAHMAVSIDAVRAVIGPLVEPGSSSCLRCADLHRAERDPAWPLLAVQLGGRARRFRAADPGLCVAAAGVAAVQALTHLDGGRPAVLDGTLEWNLPDWRLRRRSWTAHPRCGCGAAAQSDVARQNERVIMR
jgi:bacteriocin biosynthesis cyclodehydratase domain-containing protein